MNWMLLAFGVSVLFSLFYWRVIQRAIMLKMRFNLFQIRDDLRRLAIDGKEDKNSFCYKYIEFFICKTIAFGPSLGLASLSWFCWTNRNQPTNENAARFEKEASEHLAQIKNRVMSEVIKMMVVNSPLFDFLASVCATLCWILGKINKAIIYKNAEIYLDDFPKVKGGFQAA